MVFSSLVFLTLFLPLTFFLYYFLPGRCRNVLLLIVSLVFYAWGEPKHIILMLITTVYTWLLSLLLEKYIATGKTTAADFCCSSAWHSAWGRFSSTSIQAL